MNVKRVLAWIVMALMLLTSFALPGPLSGLREAEALSPDHLETAVPATVQEAGPAKDHATEGQCGSNLRWQFDPDSGELAITGSGPMYNYSSNQENPWTVNGFSHQILSVTLSKGITVIGAKAFLGCDSLTAVVLPRTVNAIGDEAFAHCTDLRSIHLPLNVTRIDAGAFLNCSSLTDVHYQGRAADRVKISIYRDNECLLNANWHYTEDSPVALAIKVQPRNIQVNEGKLATFKVKTAGATLIRWQYLLPGETDIDANWHDTGVSGSYYSVMGSTLCDGYRYRARVSNGGSSLLYSAPATLTVQQIPLAIKRQPQSVKACEGKTVALNVKTVGATRFQWYQITADHQESPIEGATSATLSLQVSRDADGCSYYCVAANDRGDEACSQKALLRVRIKISQQPRSVALYEDEFARFTVDATGYTGVQWEYQNAGSSVWTPVSKGVRETCTIAAKISRSGMHFRCKLYNNTSVHYSAKVRMTVKPAPITGPYRALLIGENEYPSSPLYGCVNDMNAMAGMLKGLDNAFSVKTLPNSSKREILKAISTTFKGATDSSVSLFYYSGHGRSSASRPLTHGALIAIDENDITFPELAEALSKVNGRVIVILDSCYSGNSIDKAAGSKDADKMLKAYNQAVIDAFSGYKLVSSQGTAAKSGELAQSKFIVITASSKTETSLDYYFDGSHYRQGCFTAALIQGMGCTYPKGVYSGATPADQNGDKQITLTELYTYARDTALSWSNGLTPPHPQHVQCYGIDSEVLFRRK